MSDQPASLRLFIAVELPDAVRERLAALQAELRPDGLDRLRWVRPEGIHVTLKFLGETPAGRRPAIEQAITQAASGVPAHELTLGRLGRFGSRNSPRVLWVDVSGDTERLKALQKRVDDLVSPLGYPAERRDFAAHLTLARVPEGLGPRIAEAMGRAIETTLVEPLPIPVRELSLMRSQLRREGAVYTQLYAAPLA
jgi:2'-5' RNA ligase